MKLETYVTQELTWLLDETASCRDLLADLAGRIARSIGGVEPDPLLQALIDREKQHSTGTPEGVAFPHAMIEGLSDTYVAAALVRKGVSFDATDGERCDVVFVLVGPPDAAWVHVSVLARLARICHGPGALDRLRAAPDSAAFHNRLIEEDRRHV